MHIILSPAKTLDYETELPFKSYSEPRFLKESAYLIKKVRKKNVSQLKNLMGISGQLAELNVQRFHDWSLPFSTDNARQAIYAFKGDVYQGLDAYGLSESEISYSQKHLSILSGLYGLLRPLDLIQPYRLEMGTPLQVTKTKPDLYKYWDKKLSKQLANDMKEAGDTLLLNLASQEYFKAIDPKLLKTPVIAPEFRDEKNGEFKIISFFAKKARGMMTTFVIKNKITKAGDLKAFDYDGYYFNEKLSDITKNKWVFTRNSKN